MTMYRRLITQPLTDALADSPVVLVNGARQTGKTTLVQSLAAERPATYLTLDDIGVLSAARSDPQGFLTGLSGPVVLDEVQHAPGLFPVLKAAVDKQRVPGRFLLTGSANVLLLPKLSESLAGRMEVLTLWPLAQAELVPAELGGAAGNLVDALFSDALFAERLPAGQDLPATEPTDLVRRLLGGGYPEPLARSSPERRRAWFNSYLTTILQRDVRDIANIEGLTDLPRLLALLASRTSSLLNQADVSRASGVPYTTLLRYLALLEATFLVQMLPPWSSNLGQRLVKAPKVTLCDTGLAASLLGLDGERLAGDGTMRGQLLETFVTMEMRKQAGWSRTQPGLFHWRTAAQQEVDLLLEDASGRLVGIEVKASGTATASDFKGLKALAEATGRRFLRGVVLYSGSQTVPFGERLHALPLSALWS